MTKLLAILLVSASTASAAITATPHLRDRIDMHIGRVSFDYALDARDLNNVKIIGWDERKLGKPMPKDDADLPTDAAAAAWRDAQKRAGEKEKDSIRDTDKLLDEVIKLRKELNAVKDKQK